MQKESWNKGKIVGAKNHLTPDQVATIEYRLGKAEQRRDLTLFRLGICTMLRASDLVKLKTSDITREGQCMERLRLRMQKTGEPVETILADKTRDAVNAWLAEEQTGTWLHVFPGRYGRGHLTERQYSRLVKSWVPLADLQPDNYSTHSIRRTKPAAIYKATGRLRQIQILLGHKSITTTEQYLGITQADALETAAAI